MFAFFKKKILINKGGFNKEQAHWIKIQKHVIDFCDQTDKKREQIFVF